MAEETEASLEYFPILLYDMIVARITYTVLVETLNPAQSTIKSIASQAVS